MILKTEYVSGGCLAALVTYAHSKENLACPDTDGAYKGVIDIRLIEAMKKESDDDDVVKYRVTLDIIEWFDGDTPKQRVEPAHLLKVYSILGEHHPAVCGNDGLISDEQAERLYAQVSMERFLGEKVPYDCCCKGEYIYQANTKLIKNLLLKLLKHLKHLDWDDGAKHELVTVLQQLRKGLD